MNTHLSVTKKHFHGTVSLIILMLFLSSCASYLDISIFKKYQPLSEDEAFTIIQLSESIPDEAEYLGEITMGNLRSGKGCDEATFYREAENAARNIGGNALKITHYESAYTLKGCPNIVVSVLKLAE